MEKLTARVVLKIATIALSCSAWAQTPFQVPTSVDSRLLMDAAGPQQREFLDAVFLVVCPRNGAGTGFMLQPGVMVTNSHVVGGCAEDSLYAISNKNEHVRFSKIINDKKRDLALLLPDKALPHALVLSKASLPEPGTTVSTWGYPLLYNGTTPLLRAPNKTRCELSLSLLGNDNPRNARIPFHGHSFAYRCFVGTDPTATATHTSSPKGW